MNIISNLMLVAVDQTLDHSLAAIGHEVSAQICHFSALAAASQSFRDDLPTCVVIEITESDRGQALEEELLQRGCERPFVVILPSASFGTGVKVMRRGALDCLAMPLDSSQLKLRISEALTLDAEQQSHHVEATRLHRHLAALTLREREVLSLIAAGSLTKEVARLLQISPKTVEVHRSNIMRKMEMGSAAELHHLLARHAHHSKLRKDHAPHCPGDTSPGSRRN